MQRHELIKLLNQWLQPEAVNDYCPNGLQIEGSETIRKVVTGVTASQALVDQAIATGADTLLVHHGYFWQGEAQPIVGMKRRRIRALLQANMNLIGYHLPLDIHPEFGNNAELIRLINQLGDGHSKEQAHGKVVAAPLAQLSPEGIVRMAHLSEPCSGIELGQRLERLLERPLVAAECHNKTIHTIAVCTGGGQGYIERAVAAGVDAFITGEVSEKTIHVARECNIQFFAAGHHATERYGIRALGEKIAAETGLSVQFIDIDNPA